MITLPTAHQLIAANARHWGNEIIWLDEAVGRVLAEPLTADRDYPPFNRATMDGIAIRCSDWEKGVRSFRVREVLYAGSTPAALVSEGECYRIMTGAAVPDSTDTVIRKEDTVAEGETVRITAAAVTKGQHIAPRGSDTAAGTTLLQPPFRVQAGAVTTLAAMGYAEVKVARLPSVAILTTGNEIIPVDHSASPVQIRNSNSHLLRALLGQWQVKPIAVRHVPDDRSLMLQAVRQLMHTDILILSGAVSAGDADYIPGVLKEAGVEQIFHRLAIRPGKPAWFGQKPGGPVVFALPGNPYSTFVTFHLLIDYYLRSCWGLEKRYAWQLALNGERTARSGLDEFFPVRFSGSPTQAEIIPFNTSGDITAVLLADALAWQPAGKPVLEEGDMISCWPLV